jgi:hypothetical protein
VKLRLPGSWKREAGEEGEVKEKAEGEEEKAEEEKGEG